MRYLPSHSMTVDLPSPLKPGAAGNSSLGSCTGSLVPRGRNAVQQLQGSGTSARQYMKSENHSGPAGSARLRKPTCGQFRKYLRRAPGFPAGNTKRLSLPGYDGPRSDRMKLKTGERNIPSNYTHFSVSTLVHFRSIHPIHPGLFESHKIKKIYPQSAPISRLTKYQVVIV